MNLLDTVVNPRTIPRRDEAEARSRRNAESLVAAAVTQAFDYMIRGAVGYGLLTTGETLVFLKVDWDDPATAYYHLVPLGEDARARLDVAEVGYWSAVSQVLAFTLLALRQSPPSQGQLRHAASTLKTWRVAFDSVYAAIREDRRDAPGSEWFPERAPDDEGGEEAGQTPTRRRRRPPAPAVLHPEVPAGPGGRGGARPGLPERGPPPARRRDPAEPPPREPRLVAPAPPRVARRDAGRRDRARRHRPGVRRPVPRHPPPLRLHPRRQRHRRHAGPQAGARGRRVPPPPPCRASASPSSSGPSTCAPSAGKHLCSGFLRARISGCSLGELGKPDPHIGDQLGEPDLSMSTGRLGSMTR